MLHKNHARCARNAPRRGFDESVAGGLPARGSSKPHSRNWLIQRILPSARYLRKVVAVKIVLENLLALQNIELVPGKATPERDTQILALRSRIPQRLLAHYDSLMANGRKGVAVVREGLCGECRRPVVARALDGFISGRRIAVCLHCRRFLCWPEAEADDRPMAVPRTRPTPRRRNSPAHV